MEISVKLTKDFERQLNKMIEKYGEDFLKLNGLNEEKLSFTNFIDNFIDSDNVANASIDPNANVGHKDVVSLINEMSKPHLKLIAMNKIYYEIKKKYGYKAANDWLELEWNKSLYLHDFPTSTMYSYSYKGTETIVVKYRDELLLTTFEDLYDIVEEDEQLLCEQDKAYCKYTDELVVWDKDNTWTKVYRVIKKPKTKDFYWVKTANGLSEIVTSNHPIITTKGDKEASEVVENEDKLYTYKFTDDISNKITEIYCTDIFEDITFKGEIYDGQPLKDKEGQVCSFAKYKGRRGCNPIQNKVVLDYDFGWMVGFVLAEGSFNHSVNITQQRNEYLENAIRICEDKNWGYAIYDHANGSNCVNLQLQSEILGDVFKYFIYGNTAWTKHLNPMVLNCNKEFLRGVVAGVVDGDGTCTSAQGRRIHIRLTSRSLINQLSFIMRMFGYTVREQTPSIYDRVGSFNQHHLIYHMAFTPTLEEEDFSSIKIKNHRLSVPYERDVTKSSNKRYTFGYGEQVVLTNEVLDFGIDDTYVYDISVETGHFVCNNILSHNCFAYDLKDVAEKGLFFIDRFNAEPPKHLESFIDMVKEHCSFCCNRSAGAVAYPNLIPYMWYFWKKDCDNGYYLKDPDTYANQQIQRLIYSLNQPYLRGGIQSSFTNVNFFDHPYYEAIFGGAEFPDGTLMIDAEEEVIEFQKRFLRLMSDIRSVNMFTYPVSTISLLVDKDKNFVDEEFARWACEHNRKWNDSNWFIDDTVTSLSSCCRLRNDVSELGYFSSIGGAALKVGSIKVSTVNLARVAYESETEKEYLKNLKKVLNVNLKVLDCQRQIIKRNVEKGLLPNFSYNLIDFEHSYSSIGIMGIYETMRKFGYTTTDEFGNMYYTDKAFEFGKSIFDTIHAVKNEFIVGKDYHINLEAIPGESAGVQFSKADRMLYPEIANNDLPLMANQWIGLGVKTTIQERVRISAAFSEYCSGGDILHINIESPFDSFEKSWDMLKYVAQKGVKYFAFTGRISACKHNHAFYGKTCPICGEPVDTEYSRIVGFFVPVKSYSKERAEEWSMRDWMKLN